MTQAKTVLLTGGTSGIGYELGKIFSKNGYDIIIVSRNGNALKKTADALSSQYANSVRWLATDLSQTSSTREIFEKMQKENIAIDVLVNNAGIGFYGDFAEVDIEKHLRLLQLNVVALTMLTRLFLPAMTKRNQGKILNIASTAAFQPGPHMAVYYASKAYVLSFSEGLASELAHTGVTVTALCPGPTKTGFENESGLNRSKVFTRLSPMSAERVANAGYQALMQGKPLVIPGFRNALLAFGNRIVPRKFASQVSKYMLE